MKIEYKFGIITEKETPLAPQKLPLAAFFMQRLVRLVLDSCVRQYFTLISLMIILICINRNLAIANTYAKTNV